MPIGFRKYVVALFFAATVATAACTSSPVETATSPSSAKPATLSVEPAVATPEFHTTSSCSNHSPYGVRIVVTFESHRDVSLRGFQFTFTDRVGRRSFPRITATTPSASPIPAPTPTSFPSSAPIPMPGFVALQSSSLRADTSQRLPFIAHFDCGVDSRGTLVVLGEFSDGHGRFHSLDGRVRVGD